MYAKLYCCVPNCSNHARSADPRTGQQVKMHKFPNPVKETERCLQWIDNVRREDLDLRNVTHKKVCSIHFDPSAYNCPTDIAKSTLLPVAVPTIVDYQSEPKSWRKAWKKKPNPPNKFSEPKESETRKRTHSDLDIDIRSFLETSDIPRDILYQQKLKVKNPDDHESKSCLGKQKECASQQQSENRQKWEPESHTRRLVEEDVREKEKRRVGVQQDVARKEVREQRLLQDKVETKIEDNPVIEIDAGMTASEKREYMLKMKHRSQAWQNGVKTARAKVKNGQDKRDLRMRRKVARHSVSLGTASDLPHTSTCTSFLSPHGPSDALISSPMPALSHSQSLSTVTASVLPPTPMLASASERVPIQTRRQTAIGHNQTWKSRSAMKTKSKDDPDVKTSIIRIRSQSRISETRTATKNLFTQTQNKDTEKQSPMKQQVSPGSCLRKNSALCHAVKLFYMRHDVSRPITHAQGASKHRSGFVMIMTLSGAYRMFRRENPDARVGFTKFSMLRPRIVRKRGALDTEICLCIYCLNARYKFNNFMKASGPARGQGQVDGGLRPGSCVDRSDKRGNGVPLTFHSALTMKAVRFTDSSADSLYIGEAPLPEPREKEVRIHVIATAINRADILQRRSNSSPPPGVSDVLGLEAAGLVDKLGPGCPSSITVGQRVMALLAGGGNAQYVTCPYQQLIPVPGRLSWDEAAAIPEVWLTAFQLLHTVGNLRAEDIVLIHAGGSGVGTAAVQLVKLAGAAAIVTAGSQEKIDLAVSLGAVTGVNYKQGNVGNKLLDLTGGVGVDLILDCVGASMFEENLKAMATDGRWVFYGALGGSQLTTNILPIQQKGIALIGSNLRSRSDKYKASLVAKFTSYAVPLFENGVLRPIISSVLPWTKIAEAHLIMEANQNMGKIVLRVSEADFEVKKETVDVQEDVEVKEEL